MNLNFNKVCIVTLLIVCIAIIPASATITLSGVKLMTDVAPGGTINYPMTLSASNTDAAVDYEFTVLGFGNSADGSYIGIDPAIDTSPNSARPYITLDRSAVTIQPGGSEVVTATVTVPTTAVGGLYALINIHPKPVAATGASANVVTAMNVPVMLTVTGTELIETGTIDSISADRYNVATVFTNTGNHHYYGLKNAVTVAESAGTPVFTSTTEPVITAIIPGGSITFVQPVDPNVLEGDYQVTSIVSSSNPADLATDTTQLALTSPGAVVPAAAPQTGGIEQPTATPAPESPMGVEVGIGAVICGIVCIGILRRK